jgi:hypothetical protein
VADRVPASSSASYPIALPNYTVLNCSVDLFADDFVNILLAIASKSDRMDFARIIFRTPGRNLRRTATPIASIAVTPFVFCALMKASAALRA